MTKLDVAKITEFAFDRGENILGKGENAGNQHFLLFPKCFLLYQRQICVPSYQPHINSHPQTLSIWTNLQFCCTAQGLPGIL